jgi:hypothetical protein
MPLGQHSTAFDGEIEAIRTALHLLNLHQNKFERAVANKLDIYQMLCVQFMNS